MGDGYAFEWPEGRKGAVSITYDDALDCHIERVAPVWDAHELNVTFYTQIRGLMRQPDAWGEVAARGHELGNHSIFHPCRKKPARNFHWLADAYDLRYYTAQRWRDEMSVANSVLELVDGKTERSFGNTCCDTELGMGDSLESLDSLIEEVFVAGRGPVNRQIVDPLNLNFNALGHFGGDWRKFDELKVEIDESMDQGGWIIYMIHGVGEGTHQMFMDDEEHRKLVNFLGEMRDEIWSSPVVEVARYLKNAN